jgi:hypothetical protein
LTAEIQINCKKDLRFIILFNIYALARTVERKQANNKEDRDMKKLALLALVAFAMGLVACKPAAKEPAATPTPAAPTAPAVPAPVTPPPPPAQPSGN